MYKPFFNVYAPTYTERNISYLFAFGIEGLSNWKGANVKDTSENVSTGKYRASNLTISSLFETSIDLLGWKD